MKLFVDDVRDAPDATWTVARSVVNAQRKLETGTVKEISIDYDMGICDDCIAAAKSGCATLNCEHVLNGYDLAEWLVEHSYLMPRKVAVHSKNEAGKRRIVDKLHCYRGHDLQAKP